MSGSIFLLLGEFWNFNKFQLNGNLFFGLVLESFGNFMNLMYLDFSNNWLNGSVFVCIGEFLGLWYLDFSNNFFKGLIVFLFLFLSWFNMFQVVGNLQFCYNVIVLVVKLVGGLFLCDSNGLLSVVFGVFVLNVFVFVFFLKVYFGYIVIDYVYYRGFGIFVWVVGIGVGVVLFLIVVIVVVFWCCNFGKD